MSSPDPSFELTCPDGRVFNVESALSEADIEYLQREPDDDTIQLICWFDTTPALITIEGSLTEAHELSVVTLADPEPYQQELLDVLSDNLLIVDTGDAAALSAPSYFLLEEAQNEINAAISPLRVLQHDIEYAIHHGHSITDLQDAAFERLAKSRSNVTDAVSTLEFAASRLSKQGIKTVDPTTTILDIARILSAPEDALQHTFEEEFAKLNASLRDPDTPMHTLETRVKSCVRFLFEQEQELDTLLTLIEQHAPAEALES